MDHFSRHTLDDSAVPSFTDFGAWDWDIVGGDVQWFGTHERLIGMQTRSLSGKVEAFSDVLHPDDRERVWKKVLGMMARQETQYSDQFRFLYSNGSVRWMSGTGRFYYDDGGRPVRMAGVVHDMTERKQAQDALRESEERFAKAFRASPHPVGITEVETGRCLEVNDACLRLFGFDREEVIGNTTLMLGIWPKHEERVRLIDRLKAGEPVRNLELSFKTKLGDIRHILVSSDLVELNGTLCLITVGNDITARKQAEQALRESEARFRTMAEAVPSFLFETDADGWNTWTSEGWCRFTGQTPEQVAGHGWAEALHPDDRAANIDRWLECMKGGLPFEAQQRLRRTDGTYAWVIARALPVRDHQGEVRRWVGSVTDVDAIVRAEEEKARLAAIVESTSDAIIGKNLQGTITSWNRSAEAVLGYTAEEAVGRPVTMLFPPDLVEEEPAILDRLKRGESITRYETVRRRKDGRDVDVSLTISPIRDRQGRILGASKILRDITERKRTEERLRENHRFISEMTSVLPGVLYIFDLQEQRNVYVNRHTGAVLGYSPEEVHALGADFIPTVLHPDDAIRLLQYFEAFKELGDGVTTQVEYRFRHRDGSYRWFLSRDVVWERNAEGQVRQILGMATDITERKQAEDRLRDSEERLRLALEGADLGSWDVDVRTGEAVWNRRHALMQGYKPESGPVSMEQWRRLVHPDDLGRVTAAIEWAKRERGLFAQEHRVYRADTGELRWLSLHGRFSYDDEGEPIRFSGVSLDITERKSEERRQEFLLRLSDVLRPLSDPLEIQRAAMQVVGELLQADRVFYADVSSDGKTCIVQDTYTSGRLPKLIGRFPTAEWNAAVDTLRRGEVVVIPDITVATELRDAERPAFACLDVRSALGVPLVKDGRWVSYLGVHHTEPRQWKTEEISLLHETGERTWAAVERARAEVALRDSEARFRSVYEHAGTGIAIADLDGGFVQCNPAFCAMLGYTEEELRGLTVHGLIHPDDLAGNRAGIERLIQEESSSFETENRYVHKQGEPVWAHKFVSLLRDHAGKAKYLVVLVTDVTERRQAEQALREAQQKLQRWNVELEQTVTVKTAELMQSQERLRALASELSLAEQRERKRLATELHDHLQQMLVYGKMTIGQGKRRIADVPAAAEVMTKVDDVLSEALTYSRTLVAELSPPVLRDEGLAAGLRWLGEYMKKYNQTVTVLIPEQQELKLPEAHRVLLFQSVRELLINSAKHAGTGAVMVTMDQHDENLSITVRDSGKGFDLVAAAAARTPSGGISSKFGLFSIQERMRALGGSFTVQSAPGLGTTATLVLPLLQQHEAKVKVEVTGSEAILPSTSALTSPSTWRSFDSRIRVLLVDDHAMVRQGLRSLLDAYDDLQVIAEAGDGAEAVKLVEDLRPRVVVMDVNMPRMNGIDATARIKTHWPETTVIGISVNAKDDNSDAMKRAGAAAVLPKESAVDQLHERIVHEVGVSADS